MATPPRVLLEVCVDSPDGLRAAVAGGADRIELCATLSVGGLTPSPGLMAAASECAVPVRAMIRPRAGDFRYTAREGEAMLRDIDAVRKAGFSGVVIGAIDDKDALDEDLLRRLSDRADGLEVALHRAVDLLPDPVTAVEVAVALGMATILTSGGARTAPEGAPVIREMQTRAAGRIEILAGSGVTAETAVALLNGTGVRALHASCGAPVAAPDRRAIEMGFAPEGERRTSQAVVENLRRTIDAMTMV